MEQNPRAILLLAYGDRLEFVDGAFMYAVKIDTSSVEVDAKINNCPADSCLMLR